MRLLFDTHLLLWAALDSPRLSREARDLFNDPGNEKFFSVVSLWEVGVKAGLRRDDFCVDAAELRAGLIANGYVELPIAGPHALLAPRLPPIHKDPFDRMLVAQAMVENLTLATGDTAVAAYSETILKL